MLDGSDLRTDVLPGFLEMHLLRHLVLSLPSYNQACQKGEGKSYHSIDLLLYFFTKDQLGLCLENKPQISQISKSFIFIFSIFSVSLGIVEDDQMLSIDDDGWITTIDQRQLAPKCFTLCQFIENRSYHHFCHILSLDCIARL